MLIDRTHRRWFLVTLVALAVAGGVYWLHLAQAPEGVRGGSPLGLTYGIIGSALMLFAGLLGARKKVPVWRVGRAQTWMRGHLWLGLLSFPLILFHSGFTLGGSLTTVLIFLFAAVVISGVAGAALQHFLPRLMTAEVPMETIYGEIENVRGQLLEEADGLVAAVCSPSPAAPAETPAASGSQSAASQVEEGVRERLRQFYQQEMRPFLEAPEVNSSVLADAAQAQTFFQQLRTLLPPSLHETLEDLEHICEEDRQLTRQARLHRWLHGWLLVHIPLSYALLVLGAVHAVMALRY